MTPEQKKEIASIFDELYEKKFKSNYKTGAPAIPPHTHNGIDNLQINANDILGLTSGSASLPFNSVQFNLDGAFAGSDAFLWDDTNKILILDKETGEGDGVKINGGTSDLDLMTDEKATGVLTTGDINLSTGSYTGDDGGASGSINLISGNADADSFVSGIYINAGNCGTLGDPGNNDGGSITILAGSTGVGTGGNITLTTGSATSTGTSGSMTFTLGGGSSGARGQFQFRQFDAFGTVTPNVMIGGVNDFGSGQGVIGIHNRTTAPSTTPSAGGVLYVEAGALMFKGSSGTVTTVAPA